MKPMLPVLTFDLPEGDSWVYEVKYDGFRTIVRMDENGIAMTSRNGKNLLPQFPEAVEFFNQYKNKITPYFPVVFDGELAVLQNPYKSDFFQMQTRGRLRSREKIEQIRTESRAVFLAFDLLTIGGQAVTGLPYEERKKRLETIFCSIPLPLSPAQHHPAFIQMVPYFTSFSGIWKKVREAGGEGVVAKHRKSRWEEGKRTERWRKYKNWKKLRCFITAFDKENGYFHTGVYKNGDIVPAGQFKNGLGKEEKEALIRTVKKNKKNEDSRFIYIGPAICVELFYLQLYEKGLREPYFHRFLFSAEPEDCTYDQLEAEMEIPVTVTHPEKPLWRTSVTKRDYLYYLKQIYPYMAPFLKNRPLTVIRYPHGISGEAFFQKHCPDYAPSFVETFEEDGIHYILCNNPETFLWLGNQLAIEFHIPFYRAGERNPAEIVIDLDPPDKSTFSLAKEAAFCIKEEIADRLGLEALLKVSGSRGLQIHFPLQANSVTWEEARLFTAFTAKYLIQKNSRAFTIERLKKKRGGKLYIDYLQYAQGKTIIAPFSVRGNKNAGVAAPVGWDELGALSTADGFSMEDVLKRVKKHNPFARYFAAENDGPMRDIIAFLKEKK